MAKPCDMDMGHEVKVSMTYISQSSDFFLYLGGGRVVRRCHVSYVTGASS